MNRENDRMSVTRRISRPKRSASSKSDFVTDGVQPCGRKKPRPSPARRGFVGSERRRYFGDSAAGRCSQQPPVRRSCWRVLLQQRHLFD